VKWSEAWLSRCFDFSREGEELCPTLSAFESCIERLGILELDHQETELGQCGFRCLMKLGSRCSQGKNVHLCIVSVHQGTGAGALRNLG
jgi:hypothetical protein